MEDLKIGLEQHAEVVWDYQAFWKCDQDFDIVICIGQNFYLMRCKSTSTQQIHFLRIINEIETV